MSPTNPLLDGNELAPVTFPVACATALCGAFCSAPAVPEVSAKLTEFAQPVRVNMNKIK